MAKQMKDRQIAHQNTTVNQLVSQITGGVQVLVQQTKQLQNKTTTLPTVAIQTETTLPSLQQNSIKNNIQQGQQNSSAIEMQQIDQMLQKFFQEIGKMDTEYNQLKSANMNPLHLQQLMQQKANALQTFSNQIQQLLNEIQLSNQTIQS